MSTVTNQYGKEISYETAFNLMDEDICNNELSKITPCSEQEFFDAYCIAHQNKFSDEFEPSKSNPVW